jgi:hypothetical protein
VLFGGHGPMPLSDTWTWDGSTWTQLSIPGPPGRWSAAMSALGGKIVLYGGADFGTELRRHVDVRRCHVERAQREGPTGARRTGDGAARRQVCSLRWLRRSDRGRKVRRHVDLGRRDVDARERRRTAGARQSDDGAVRRLARLVRGLRGSTAWSASSRAGRRVHQPGRPSGGGAVCRRTNSVSRRSARSRRTRSGTFRATPFETTATFPFRFGTR